MADLFDPRSGVPARDRVRTAIAELEALASEYRRQAAACQTERTAVVFLRAADQAEARAEALKTGSRPYA
jgi:hypothetical protein